ncbi:MAG: 50S ribosomal protein L13 [Nanohaloarchaea archaeon SW_7_43_1]|nr:MAG: 50S ribosomal protein L13 [Nanohaloarchaea archaeon SW_7_43_1]
MAVVLDAENKISGRLATHVSRKLKDSEEVKVVNAEKAVVSGSKEEVLSEYKQKYERGSRDFGPHHPKSPERILKRITRNMISDTEEGKRQLSNLKMYLGHPKEIGEAEDPGTKQGDQLKNKNYVKLGEISKHIGWEPKGELE